MSVEMKSQIILLALSACTVLSSGLEVKAAASEFGEVCLNSTSYTGTPATVSLVSVPGQTGKFYSVSIPGDFPGRAAVALNLGAGVAFKSLSISLTEQNRSFIIYVMAKGKTGKVAELTQESFEPASYNAATGLTTFTLTPASAAASLKGKFTIKSISAVEVTLSGYTPPFGNPTDTLTTLVAPMVVNGKAIKSMNPTTQPCSTTLF
jgi:hypothetical protein